MEWNKGKPPNETWVLVKDGDKTIEAMAFYGRDGYLPHWQLRDESVRSPNSFKFWKELENVEEKNRQ